MARRVVLYELNEVPWDVVDHYVEQRPDSTLAGLLGRSRCLTTLNEDPVDLQPWRTWPTFHMSRYTEDHNSYDLGQDPETFVGDPIWEVADRAGRRVGICGPMQSWPPRPLANGGFHIPDTFARTADTFPASVRRFQAFNLSLTRENSFSSAEPLRRSQLALAAVDLVRLGLRPSSAWRMAAHLVGEQREDRRKGFRAAMQVIPYFDIYWRLHQRHQPDLSIFFTNHVAGVMHRYWGDGMPGYAQDHDYVPDDVFSTFLNSSMDLVDLQLTRILRDIDADTALVIASSMGQGPIRKHDMAACYVVDDTDALARALGFGSYVIGSAMYPRFVYTFDTEAEAVAAAAAVGSVHFDGRNRFVELRCKGRTISFGIDFGPGSGDDNASWATADGTERTGSIADLGIEVKQRLGGGNTGYHIPEGILIAHGAGIGAHSGRDKVSVLDAAPSILDFLGVEAPSSMRGEVGALG